MKFKAALKYHISGLKYPLIIFYIVIYALIFLITIPLKLTEDTGFEVTGGFEMASVIFLFVCGLNSFKSPFRMLLTNSVARRTMFTSFLTAAAATVIIMAVIDSLSGLALTSMGWYKTFYLQLYGARYSYISALSFQVLAEGFLWRITAYAAAMIAGFLITVLYYRMNKAVKLIVSIGVPVFFLILFPYIDWRLFRGAITASLIDVSGFLSGYGYNPYISILVYLILFAVLGALSFTAVRRAPIKE